MPVVAEWKIVRLGVSDKDKSAVLARLHCEDQTFVDVTAAYLADLARDFPLVDARTELEKAARWVENNPEKRKPARQADRYLLTWFGYANDEVIDKT